MKQVSSVDWEVLGGAVKMLKQKHATARMLRIVLAEAVRVAQAVSPEAAEKLKERFEL
jgi:hypothetical protein